MKETEILSKIGILILEFIILWFFGVLPLCYALSLTDTFSAVVIWIGGGMSFGAFYIIKNMFSELIEEGEKSK